MKLKKKCFNFIIIDILIIINNLFIRIKFLVILFKMSQVNKYQASLQFTVNPTEPIAFKKVDFYICNNIYYSMLKDESKVDTDFKIVKFNKINNEIKTDKETNKKQNIEIETTYSKTERGEINRICISTLMDKGRKQYIKIFKVDDIDIEFSYKGVTINVISERGDYYNHTINSQEDTQYRNIVLTFKNNEDMSIIPEFLNSVIKYVDIHMFEVESEIGKLCIYCNDEGYWDKTITKKYRNMDTIYLPKKDKEMILNDVEWFLSKSTKERYESIGRVHKRVYLFEGLPGSGKTSFISSIASKIGYDIAIISFTEKVTDGTLIRLMKNLPEKTILVIEDIDVLFQERKKNDTHKNLVTFSGILNNLDGITTKDGFMCFITTNYKDCLDKALLRPGRVDKQLKFTYIVKEQMYDMFNKFMGDKYTEDKFNTFYSMFRDIKVRVSVSLIQEYLFKYLDDPDKAIENVEEIKKLYDQGKDKDANMWS